MVADHHSAIFVAVTLILMSVADTGGKEACHVKEVAVTMPRYITSPGFPYGYDRNISCRWDIYADEGKNIKIDVIMSDLDTRPFTPCKRRDHVEVLDGGDTLGLFCGKETPTYVSTRNSVVIKFQSTALGEAGKGFKLKYYEGIFAHKIYKTKYLQGGSATQTFYPHYVSYTDYRFVKMSWRIESFHRIDKRVLYIRTLSSNLLGHTDNYMEAFDGDDSASESLGKWYGSELVDKFTSGHNMFIVLNARHFNKDVKFEIEYGTRIKDSGTSPSVAKIAGISIGVIASLGVAFLVIKILCIRYKDKSDEDSNADDTEDAARRQILVQNDHPIHQPTPHRLSPSAPPSREEIEILPPPPSYEEVMRTMT